MTEQELQKIIGLSGEELAIFFQSLGEAARKVAECYFRKTHSVDYKDDDTPVTVADRETEERLRGLIKNQFPNHGIVGEEFGAHGKDWRCVWVIDPIDGTRGFITGTPLFGSLVGLVVDENPQAGLLEVPAMRERWVSVPGLGTALDGMPCHTSTRTSLCDASLFATSPDMFSAEESPRFRALGGSVKVTRFGADCYAYGLVASGHADLVVEADMGVHDYIALIPLIEGAGGVMTDWNGDRLGFESDGRVVAAATPELHRNALAFLSD